MKAYLACALALLAASGGCVGSVRTETPGESLQEAENRRVLAERLVSGWWDSSRIAARLMLERYGPPQEVHSSRLVWRGNGPWLRTVVRDLTPPYAGSKTEELGVLEQTIAYPAAREAALAVRSFDKKVLVDPKTGELSARSDSEPLNYLRLNLAEDVIRGRLTPEQARESYARILELEAAGKTTHYMGSLRFGPSRKP